MQIFTQVTSSALFFRVKVLRDILSMNFFLAVEALYSSSEVAVGIKRPLPLEVKAETAPKYTRLKVCSAFDKTQHFNMVYLPSKIKCA